MTTTEDKPDEEKAEPSLLTQVEGMPDDPAAKAKPGDFFSVLFVQRDDDGVPHIIADDNWMPLGTVVEMLRTMADKYEVLAQAQAETRAGVFAMEDKYRELIAAGVDPETAKRKCLLLGITDSGARLMAEINRLITEKNDDGGEASTTS